MDRVPDFIDLFDFTKREVSFSKEYSLKDFSRLRFLINNENNTIKADLKFYLNENKIPHIKGEIKLQVKLKCQRCLENAKIILNPLFDIAFVTSERQNMDDSDCSEIILIKDDRFSLIDFLTDEILLSIPMIVKHDNICTTYKNKEINIKKHNPFTILKQLKEQNNGSTKK